MPSNNFTQLMTADGATLTVEQRAFVEAHKQIISCGTMAGTYFVELAKQLKRMRDEKLYKAAGFEDFGDYAQEAVGLKERQAYNYIKVAEKYSETYLIENAGLGVTKLLLLASVTESEREDISENVDLKSANVSEIDAAVKAAIRERDEKQRELEKREKEVKDLRAEVEENSAARDSLQTAYDAKKKELREAKDAVAELKAQKAELEKSLDEAKQATPVEYIPDEAAQKEAEEQKQRAEELERKLEETQQKLEEAKAQKKAIASDSMLTFKIKYEDWQRFGNELVNLIRGMEEDFAFKCKKALSAAIAGWEGGLGI